MDASGYLIGGEPLPAEAEHFRAPFRIEAITARDVDVPVAVPLDFSQEVGWKNARGVHMLHFGLPSNGG